MEDTLTEFSPNEMSKYSCFGHIRSCKQRCVLNEAFLLVPIYLFTLQRRHPIELGLNPPCYRCTADALLTSLSLTEEVAGLNNILTKKIVTELSENISRKLKF